MIPFLFTYWFLFSFLFFLLLFRVLSFRFAHRFEEIFFCAAASLGWMSACTVTLGLFGLARLPYLHGAALLSGAAAAPLLRKGLGAPSPPPVPRPGAYALCAASLLWLPLAFIPPFFYDALRYHDGLPSLYLRTGFTWPLPHFVESNYALGGEMLSMIGMADGSHFGAGLVNLFAFFLCGLGILSLADRVGNRRAGLFGLVLFLSCPTAIHMLFVRKTDIFVALFFFATVYALLLVLRDGGGARLLLAGAFAGVAVAAKYTMGLFVVVALAVWLRERARARDGGIARALREAALFCVAAGALFLPWLWRNLAATGNPVYPFLNGIFRSPAWSPARMALLYGDSNPAVAMLHGWGDVASLLGSVTFFPNTALSGPGASLGAGLVGALVFPLIVRRPEPPWRFLRDVSLALAAAWFLSVWLTRYLFPALPAMALLAGFLGDRLAARIGEKRGTAVAAALVACALAAQLGAAFRQTPIHKAWASSFALVGHPERRAQVVARFHPSLGAVKFANDRLPEGARLLLLGETRVYYLRRTVDAPSPFDEHPIARIAAEGPDAETVRKRLAAMGYTHILVNWAEWERLSRQYFSRHWGPGEIDAADRFVRQLPAVYSERGAAILSLEKL